MAQVPPPPQAEGRNIFLLDKVVSKLNPASASIASCPFISIFTGPEAVSFAFANRIRPTRSNVNKRNTVVLAIMVVVSNANIIIRH
jgi:hypothetical protein